MLRRGNLHLHAVTIPDPDVVHRHAQPVAAHKTLNLAGFATGDPAMLFHHFRQLIDRVANRVIGRSREKHLRLIRISRIPAMNKILVCLSHRYTIGITVIRQKIRQPRNFLRLHALTLTRRKEYQTFRGCSGFFKISHPALEGDLAQSTG